MKEFTYTIEDELGIHARPAGLLAKFAKTLDSSITITKGGKSAAATKLIAVIGLGVKTGEIITITMEGGDEEANAAAMERFCKENMQKHVKLCVEPKKAAVLNEKPPPLKI